MTGKGFYISARKIKYRKSKGNVETLGEEDGGISVRKNMQVRIRPNNVMYRLASNMKPAGPRQGSLCKRPAYSKLSPSFEAILGWSPSARA